MPKRLAPPSPLSRKQLSRRAKEEKQRRWLLIGTAALFALVVLIIAWGLYDQYVLRPRKPVATVEGTVIRLDTYQKYVRYRRADYRNYLQRLESYRQSINASGGDQTILLQYIDQQIQQVKQQLMSVSTTVLEELIDDQIIRHECARRGITASEDEVQLRLEEQFGYDRNPPTPEPTPVTATVPITVTPTPTTAPMTEEQFLEESRAYFTRVQQETGFTERDFRYLIETSILREKLEAALKAEAPTTGEQVHARHILVKTREEAEQVLARLRAGESFEALAQEVSTDESNKDKGGDLGWFGRGVMVKAFEDAAFALEPGQISDIVETSFGFHIIRVDERDPNRPLEGAALQQAQEKAVEDWFNARRTAPDVVRSWDSSMIPPDTTAGS